LEEINQFNQKFKEIMENTGSTLVALLTGAIVGAGVAILYAPDKGENTRRKINDEAKRAKDRLDKQFTETSSRLGERARRARASFDTRLDETLNSASHKADDIIDALESRLEELRAKNAKLQNDTGKTKPATATTTKKTATA
jgi:gas vesicle protein